MAAEVETMFYTKRKTMARTGNPGGRSTGIKGSTADCRAELESPPGTCLYGRMTKLIQGYKANVRDSDRKILGVVTEPLQGHQNGKPLHLQMPC